MSSVPLTLINLPNRHLGQQFKSISSSSSISSYRHETIESNGVRMLGRVGQQGAHACVSYASSHASLLRLESSTTLQSV